MTLSFGHLVFAIRPFVYSFNTRPLVYMSSVKILSYAEKILMFKIFPSNRIQLQIRPWNIITNNIE